LGPLLFDIYVNDLSDKLDFIPGIKHGFFADDLTISTTEHIPVYSQDRLQTALNTVTQWCVENFMQVNAAKSEYIVVSRASNSTVDKQEMTLKIADNLINRVQTSAPRLLGIRFDSMANFGQHVQYVKKTVQSRLKQLSAIAGSSWGPLSHDLRSFLYGHVTSILTYGAEIWHPQLSRSNKEILEILHRRGARIVSGCLPSTADVDVLREAHLDHIEDIVTLNGIKYVEMCRRLGGVRETMVTAPFVPATTYPHDHFRKPYEDAIASVCNAHNISGDHARVPILTRSRFPPWATANASRVKLFTQTTPPVAPLPIESRTNTDLVKQKTEEKLAANIATLKLLGDHDYELWTDGSCQKSEDIADLADASSDDDLSSVDEDEDAPPNVRTGGAAILYSGEARIATTRRAAGPLACSYRAEAVALLAGLEEFRSRNLKNCTLLVCSDSQSLISALAVGPIGHRGDIENHIWSVLLELADANVEVTLQFVFSHCGLPRNDEVDAEAKKATKLSQSNIPIWLTDMLSAARRHIRSQRRLKERADTYRTRNVTSLMTSLKALSMPRTDAVLLSRIRTNEHPHLGRFAHRIGTSMCTACRWCCTHEHPEEEPLPEVQELQIANEPRSATMCPTCNMVLSNRGNCVKHMTQKHPASFKSNRDCYQALGVPYPEREQPPPPPVERPLRQCPHCPLQCRSAGGMTRHINTAHPEHRAPPPPMYTEQNFLAKQGEGPEETPDHLIFDCPALNAQRLEAYGTSSLTRETAGRDLWYSSTTAKFIRNILGNS
jgi:ribonuclease HI/uncharacterized C2H2 Zn-finger protein